MEISLHIIDKQKFDVVQSFPRIEILFIAFSLLDDTELKL